VPNQACQIKHARGYCHLVNKWNTYGWVVGCHNRRRCRGEVFLSSRGSFILFPFEGGRFLDICTVRVLVSSHFLQVHLYDLLQPLVLLLEGPYTTVCSTSACFSQEGNWELRGDQLLGSTPNARKAKRCASISSICVDREGLRLKYGRSEQQRHKL
jgi:hypothetical protein